ncbi:lipase 3-like [Prorops nasuta]|uniref:lipase 3-like n=1 Tax=Prorops nasuta TaxID=863751 RepID=UPI0034CDC6B7
MILTVTIDIILLLVLFAPFINGESNDSPSTNQKKNTSATAPINDNQPLSFYLDQFLHTLLIHDYSKEWNIPDVTYNPAQMLTRYGYNAETHTVITEDGYILTLFRVIGDKKGSTTADRPVVMVQHGVLVTSCDWTVTGPEQAFAFALADAGYDVWLSNARGSTYSRNNVKLSSFEKKFWDFSYHEIGVYDLAANIDYILNVTGQKKLFYIGHSMGTTAGYILLSERPDYNKKLYAMFNMAPVVYVNFKSPLVNLLLPFFEQIAYLIYKIYGSFELAAKHNILTRSIVDICLATTPIQPICINTIFSSFGYDYANFNLTTVPAIGYNTPGGSSLKVLLHYSQNDRNGKFLKFDYKSKNVEYYGQKDPPEYNLSNTKIPVHIFYGSNDWLCTHGKELDKLINNIGGETSLYVVDYNAFTHIDFPYAKNANELVYKKIINLIDNFNVNTDA